MRRRGRRRTAAAKAETVGREPCLYRVAQGAASARARAGLMTVAVDRITGSADGRLGRDAEAGAWTSGRVQRIRQWGSDDWTVGRDLLDVCRWRLHG